MTRVKIKQKREIYPDKVACAGLLSDPRSNLSRKVISLCYQSRETIPEGRNFGSV